MQPLSILFTIDDRYPDSSGVSRSMQMQAEELTRLGHKITIIAPKSSTTSPANVTVIPTVSYRVPGLPKHTFVLGHSLRVARRISQSQTFNIVHSQTDTGALVLAARIARLQNIPHVHTLHTDMADSLYQAPIVNSLASAGYRLGAYKARRASKNKPKMNKMSADTLKDEPKLTRFDWRSQAIMASSVDAITTPASFMLDNIRSAASSLAILGEVIPTGYDNKLKELSKTMRRSRPGDKLRFISVGRLDKEKRTDVIIKAFKNARIPNSELVIIGDGSEKVKLQLLANGLPTIRFIDHISSREELFQELCNADIFVLASYRFDTQAIVLLEALLANLPVLYCDNRLTAGVNSRNSILTDPSVDSITKGMRQLTNQPLRESLRANTKSSLENFSPTAMCKAYEKLYRTLTKQNLQ